MMRSKPRFLSFSRSLPVLVITLDARKSFKANPSSNRAAPPRGPGRRSRLNRELRNSEAWTHSESAALSTQPQSPRLGARPAGKMANLPAGSPGRAFRSRASVIGPQSAARGLAHSAEPQSESVRNLNRNRRSRHGLRCRRRRRASARLHGAIPRGRAGLMAPPSRARPGMLLRQPPSPLPSLCKAPRGSPGLAALLRAGRGCEGGPTATAPAGLRRLSAPPHPGRAGRHPAAGSVNSSKTPASRTAGPDEKTRSSTSARHSGLRRPRPRPR